MRVVVVPGNTWEMALLSKRQSWMWEYKSTFKQMYSLFLNLHTIIPQLLALES